MKHVPARRSESKTSGEGAGGGLFPGRETRRRPSQPSLFALALLRWSRPSCASVLLALALSGPSTLQAAARPEGVAELLRQGDFHFEIELYRDALAFFEKARAQDPANVAILVRVARSREALWDPDAEEPANRKLLETAAGEFEGALGRDPDSREALDGYCRASARLDREKEVFAFLLDRAAKRPKDARTVAWLVELCPSVGCAQGPEFWIRRWIAVTPNAPEAHAALGSLLWDRSYNTPADQLGAARRREIVDEGMSAVDRAIALEPNYSTPMVFKGLLFHELARLEPDPSKKAALRAKADDWKKRSYEARQRPMTREIAPLLPVLPPPRPKKPGA